MFTPFLRSIALRHAPIRPRYFRAQTAPVRRARPLRFEKPPADLSRLQLLRKKAKRLRGRGKPLSPHGLLRLIGDISEAIGICCSFIRVHQAPGQYIVNEVWLETILIQDMWELLTEREKEFPEEFLRFKESLLHTRSD